MWSSTSTATPMAPIRHGHKLTRRSASTVVFEQRVPELADGAFAGVEGHHRRAAPGA
jgi:hypothetical protein